ncbi:leucine-rich repeat-containing protein 51 isoform X2 [Columba livia]|uniref:leucine-rich repeat-containing protein 51 isoform X2 n=1 Tax=Columba livia TaxID=8932 RepID=UPI0031BB4A5C
MSPPQNAAVGAIAAVTPPLPATHRVPAGCDPHPPPGCYPKIPPPTRKQPQIRGDRTRRWGCETPDCTGTSPLSPGGSLVPRGPSRGAGVAPSPARAGGAGKGGFKPAPAAAGAPVERTRPPGAAKRRKANGGAREAPRWSPPRPAAVSGAGSASGGGQTPPHLRPPVSPPRGPDRPPTPSYRVRGRPPRAVPPPGFKRFVPPPLLPYWSPEGWGASRGEEDEGKLPIPAAPCRRAGLARAGGSGLPWERGRREWGGGGGSTGGGREMLAWEEQPELGPPLDFSFCNISTIKDLLQTQPRSGPVPPRLPPPALRLNNNQLGGLGELPPTLRGLRLDPALLRWLDLSFNRLQHIHPVLSTLGALQSLQLHGNDIGELGEVDKLGVLPQLRRLTLHGNPMEELRGYRSYVLSQLSHLTSLDFSAVTKQDREDAAIAQRGKKKGGGPGRRAAPLAP